MIWPILLLAQVDAATPAMIESVYVEARLFYQDTGRLSDNLLVREKPFHGWNTIIGEGDTEEQADDLMVAVRLQTIAREENLIAGPVTLRVTDGSGKILGKRTWRTVLTSGQGGIVLPLWLNDVTCAGNVSMRATYGNKTAVGKLYLFCGE